jgi:site-specific DNA recombinase
MTNCVIYVRVSTQNQAEKELPITSQIEKCEEHAKSLGAKVINVYKDEGISGRTDSRPAFQKAIAYCESFDVDFFICWSTSRFARNALEAKVNKRRLEKANTEISYVSQTIDKGNSGFIYEGILELFDEYYSRQVSQDTLRAMISNAQAGYYNGGTTSLGFKAVKSPDNPKKKILVPEPMEVLTVKRVFDLKLSGLGALQIARILNDETRLNRGKLWNKSAVLNLLRNERANGKTAFVKKTKEGVRPKSEWIVVDSHQPIIDNDTFNAVQQKMDAETREKAADQGSPKSTRLFTGLLKCEKCGASMVIERAKGSSKVYYYYNCKTKLRGEGCENRRINSAEFDTWLSEVICNEIFTKKNLSDVLVQLNELCGSWKIKHNEKVKDLEHQVRTLKLRNSRLYELIEDPEMDYNIRDLAPRVRLNNESIKTLENQLLDVLSEQPPKFTVDESDLTMLSELLTDIIQNTQAPGKVRDFFKTFIDKIVLKKNQVSITYRPDVLVSASLENVPSSINWQG